MYGGTQAEMARLINDSGVLGDSITVTAETVKDVPFDKVIEAIHKVQQNIGITGTTSKEAATTIEGSTASVKAAWDNLMVGIADPENQNVGALLKAFADSLITAAKQAIPRIKAIVKGMAETVKTIWNEALPELEVQFPEIKPVIDKLQWLKDNAKFIAAGIAAIVTALAAFKAVSGITLVVTAFKDMITNIKGATTAMEVFNAVTNNNAIGIIITLIAAAVAAFITLWNTSDSFRNFWIGLWDNVKSVVSTAVDAIVGFFTETLPNGLSAVINFFTELPSNIANLLVGAVDAVGTWASDMVGKATEMGSNFLTEVGNFFIQLPSNIANWLAGVIASVAEWGANMAIQAAQAGANFIAAVGQFFQQLPYNVGVAIGTALGTVVQWGIDLYNFATTAIPQFVNAVVQFISQLPTEIATFLAQVISNVSTWAVSMATKAREAGTNFLNNVVNFIQQLPARIATFLSNVISRVASWGSQMATNARQAGSNFVNNVISFIQQLPAKVSQFLQNVISSLGSWVSQMGSKGREAASNLGSNLLSGLRALPGQMASIGSAIVQGIWSGISGAAGWLAGQVRSFAKGILDGMKSALGIHSPSRVFRDEVGKNLAKGVGVGFTDEMKSVTADMQNAIPTSFDVGASVKGSALSGSMSSFDTMVSAFKQALAEMKIEMDGDEMGKFVDKTVTRLVYA